MFEKLYRAVAKTTIKSAKIYTFEFAKLCLGQQKPAFQVEETRDFSLEL